MRGVSSAMARTHDMAGMARGSILVALRVEGKAVVCGGAHI